MAERDLKKGEERRADPKAGSTKEGPNGEKGHDGLRPPIGKGENSQLTADDMMQFIVAALNPESLVGHNTNAFNNLIDEGIPQILTELFHETNVVKDHREQTEMD